MKSTNDVHSPKFKSKLDIFFTAAVKEGKWGKYERWDKDLAKIALTQPISKTWGKRSLNCWSKDF